MDIQVRTLLTQNGFNLSLSLPPATFDYPSFTHKFTITNLIAEVPENFEKSFSNYSSSICSILKLFGVPKVFKKLEGSKMCFGLLGLDCLTFASSFTQLSRFYYFYLKYAGSCPQEFIVKILETANTNLKDIHLDLKEIDAIKLLCKMAKNILESLETVKIGMEKFTAD
ncbi:8228_t:CDS:2, partial [Diversispora eburnea]